MNKENTLDNVSNEKLVTNNVVTCTLSRGLSLSFKLWRTFTEWGKLFYKIVKPCTVYAIEAIYFMKIHSRIRVTKF